MTTLPPTITLPQPQETQDDLVDERGMPRYGWRYVRRIVHGREEWEQQPLTLDDVLHPQEGDYVIQTSLHDYLCSYFAMVLQRHLEHDPTALVLSDVRIEWDVADIRPHCPDVAVLFGVRHQEEEWRVFRVAREEVRPALIIEITSHDTRQLDVVRKLNQYARVGVGFYAIVDMARRKAGQPAPIKGYRLPAGKQQYEPVPLDEQGRLYLEPVGLWLAPYDNRAALFDDQEHKFDDYLEQAHRADEAEQARQAEARRADEAEQARQAEARRADEAEQARQAEARRVQELEAELRRLRGEKKDAQE
jgi:Uma2 family endonuclease